MVQQLSKSGSKESPVLKAGHPPAVKAGGKRVAKKSLEDGATHGTPEKETKRSDKVRLETTIHKANITLSPNQPHSIAKNTVHRLASYTRTPAAPNWERANGHLLSVATSNRMQQVGILLAGTLDKLSHDFPETPVSVRHSKVRPAVEKTHSPRTFFIQQPRKF